MSDIQDWIYRDIPTRSNIDYDKLQEVLGFKLFVWQKTFIEYGHFRQYGETTAKILRELLTDTHLELVLDRPQSAQQAFYQHQLLDIYEKLKASGIECKTVIRKRGR